MSYRSTKQIIEDVYDAIDRDDPELLHKRYEATSLNTKELNMISMLEYAIVNNKPKVFSNLFRRDELLFELFEKANKTRDLRLLLGILNLLDDIAKKINWNYWFTDRIGSSSPFYIITLNYDSFTSEGKQTTRDTLKRLHHLGANFDKLAVTGLTMYNVALEMSDESLFQFMISIDPIGKPGFNTLIYSTRIHNFDTFKFLIDLGVPIHNLNKTLSVLQYIKRDGEDKLKYMIDKNLIENWMVPEALYSFSQGDLENINLVRILLDNGYTNGIDKALFVAHRNKRNVLELMELLIGAGADVNAKVGGSTVLRECINNSDISTIEYLLRNGANPNTLNQYDNVPLAELGPSDDDYYISNQTLEIIDLLISYGASPWLIRNKNYMNEVIGELPIFPLTLLARQSISIHNIDISALPDALKEPINLFE